MLSILPLLLLTNSRKPLDNDHFREWFYWQDWHLFHAVILSADFLMGLLLHYIKMLCVQWYIQASHWHTHNGPILAISCPVSFSHFPTCFPLFFCTRGHVDHLTSSICPDYLEGFNLAASLKQRHPLKAVLPLKAKPVAIHQKTRAALW